MPLHGHDISHLPPPSDPVIETCYSLFTSAPVGSVDFKSSLGHLSNRKGFPVRHIQEQFDGMFIALILGRGKSKLLVCMPRHQD